MKVSSFLIVFIFFNKFYLIGQPVCIKSQLENDFPSGIAILGCDTFFHHLWSNSSFSTINILHPSETNKIFKLSIELYPNYLRQEILPAFVNGQWLSSASISTSDNFIIEPINEGKTTISYKSLGPGCFTLNTSRDFEVVDNNYRISDSYTSIVEDTLKGNVAANDQYIPNIFFDTIVTLALSPFGSTPQLFLNKNGDYSFITNLKGKYIYILKSCRANCCTNSILTIHAIEKYTSSQIVANSDYSVTLINSSSKLTNLANDDCVSNKKCFLDFSSLEFISLPKHGTISNQISSFFYTPTAGFIGNDTFQYKVCMVDNPSYCDTAFQVILVKDSLGLNNTTANNDFKSLLQDSLAFGNVLDNDNDAQNDHQTVISKIETKLSCTFNLQSDGTYIFTPLLGFKGRVEFQYTVCDDNSINPKCANASIEFLVMPPISLKIRTYLEGALMNSNEHTSNGRPLMRDNLRVSPFNGNLYIPSQDPYQFPVINNPNLVYDLSATPELFERFKEVGCGLYSRFRSISDSSIFTVSGQDAIVDWVFVELRDKDNYFKVIASRSGLLQRDGDIVDIDGISPLLFPDIDGSDYFIVLKHRNHLSVMSKESLNAEVYTTMVDFTSPNFLTYDKGLFNNINYIGTALKNSVKPGFMCMYAGDFDSNGIIKFESPNDDLNILINDVLSLSGDTNLGLNYDNALGYLPSDYNMNSKSKFDNPFDDRNFLFAQVLFHPINFYLLSNSQNIIEQLP